MKLALPLKHIFVTQAFGRNDVPFYKKLGLEGHNGVDFRATVGCPCFASMEGTISYARTDTSGGKCVIIEDRKKGYKVIYYHLDKIDVKRGQSVQVGDKIGLCGNSGKYTTGPHLQFGLKEIDKSGRTLNWNNGFKGAIDPVQFFPRNWDKSAAYHRYGKKQSWWAEFYFKFTPIKEDNKHTRDGRWVHKRLKAMGLKPPLSTERVNAILYGAWDFQTVMNDALYFSKWGFLTKKDYNKGKKPF